MGSRASVVDNDVIEAICSDDINIKCTTISKSDIIEINIHHEPLKTVKNIRNVISMADRLRRIVITKSLTNGDLTTSLLESVMAKAVWVCEVNY